MVMTDRNLVGQLLQGMVRCQHCNAPMEIMGHPEHEAPSYVCNTRNEGCAAPSIEAEPFSRLVVRRAIHAFLDPRNTARVLDVIVDEATAEGNGELLTVLDLPRPEPAPSGERPARLETRRAGDPEPTIVTTTDAELEEVNPLHDPGIMYASLSYPEREAPRVDTAYRKVEEYSLDPETYLRPGNLRTTRTIMEALVVEIVAGPASATIHYRLPVHPGGSPQPRTSEEVPTT